MRNYDNIPDELKVLNQWVIVGKADKYPRQLNGMMASVSNPSTWSSYDDAYEIATICGFDLGFVFRDNGYVGIDIDDGYDSTGQMSALAEDILTRCYSYAEKSRSGRGFHVIVKGDLPWKGKNNQHGLEMYKDARYFIMTGDMVGLSPNCIYSEPATVNYILKTYFPENSRETTCRQYSNRVYNPEWVQPTDGKRFRVRPVYPRIPNGCRNICLTSLAGMMHNIGYDADRIYDELCYANEAACDPMLDADEIGAIVRSVTRYKR